MKTEITITMSSKEYEAMKRQQDRIKTLYKALKTMSCFETENNWNSKEDITNGLTKEETCYIFDAIQRIHAYTY